MRKALLLAFIVSGCAIPSSPVETGAARPAPVAAALCRLGFRAVPLRTLASGHHIVDVELNGRPATFVLDTGASATIIHTPEAANFGITGEAIGSRGAIGLGGGQPASQYRIDSFAIGGVPTRQRRISALNLAQVTSALSALAGAPVHGIIGQDVMNEHRAIIDVRAAAVHLMEADSDPAPVRGRRC